METIRKTGLGDSLLLRRTEAPPTAVPAVPADVQTPDLSSPPEPTSSVPAIATTDSALPQPSSKKRPKEQLVLRDRCTLYLERAVNERLDMAARIEGRERSEVATDILQKYLPKYRVERET